MQRSHLSGETTVTSRQGTKSRLSEYAEKLPRGSKVDNVRALENQLAALAAARDVTAILGLTEGHGRKGLKRYRSLVPCWAGSLCVGTALGYALPAGRTLDAAAHRGILEVPHRQIVWFGSMLSLGAVFGSLAGALMTQLSGRRCSLHIAAVGLLASWLVIGLSRSMYYYCGARFFCGFLIGVVSIVVPAHVAEIAPVTHRGVLGAVHQLAVALGILYAYSVGRFLDWDWLAVLCAPPAAALFLLTRAFVIESPRWFLQMGDSLAALNALTAVRGSRSQADIELDAIQAVLPKYRTPVAHYLLAILLMVTQQLSGINSVIITTVSADPELDVSVPSTDSAILLALLQAATVLVVLPFVDTLGRRKLLVVSVVVCWGSMTYLGIIYYTYGRDKPVVIHEWTKTPPDYTYEELATPDAATDTYGTLKFALKVLFVVGFSVGLGPVPWVLAAELVPLRGTGLEFGSVCAANWAGSFVTANFVTTTTTSRMTAVSLWLYGCIAITGGLISFALLPDTDCMSIEDVLLIDPDERARRTKIKSTHKGKVFAPPGSMWPAISTAVAQPQKSLTKTSMPDRRSSNLTRSQDSDAKKPQSSLSHAPTEALTKEKPRSDDSQAQSKAPNKEFGVVTEQRERTMDSRKSSVASRKSTVSKSSASSGHPGRRAKKAKGVE